MPNAEVCIDGVCCAARGPVVREIICLLYKTLWHYCKAEYVIFTWQRASSRGRHQGRVVCYDHMSLMLLVGGGQASTCILVGHRAVLLWHVMKCVSYTCSCLLVLLLPVRCCFFVLLTASLPVLLPLLLSDFHAAAATVAIANVSSPHHPLALLIYPVMICHGKYRPRTCICC